MSQGSSASPHSVRQPWLLTMASSRQIWLLWLKKPKARPWKLPCEIGSPERYWTEMSAGSHSLGRPQERKCFSLFSSAVMKDQLVDPPSVFLQNLSLQSRTPLCLLCSLTLLPPSCTDLGPQCGSPADAAHFLHVFNLIPPAAFLRSKSFCSLLKESTPLEVANLRNCTQGIFKDDYRNPPNL